MAFQNVVFEWKWEQIKNENFIQLPEYIPPVRFIDTNHWKSTFLPCILEDFRAQCLKSLLTEKLTIAKLESSRVYENNFSIIDPITNETIRNPKALCGILAIIIRWVFLYLSYCSCLTTLL